MSIEQFLGKKYKLVESDNFQEYMKALDVNGVLRKVATTLHPELVLSKSQDEYTLTAKLPFKEIVTKFKPGVEFDQETPDGREVKAVITIEGSTLHEVQRDEEDGKETILDRTFSDTEVKMVMKVGDVTATRTYSAQAQDKRYY